MAFDCPRKPVSEEIAVSLSWRIRVAAFISIHEELGVSLPKEPCKQTARICMAEDIAEIIVLRFARILSSRFLKRPFSHVT